MSQGKPLSAQSTSTKPPKESDGASWLGAKPRPPSATAADAKMGTTSSGGGKQGRRSMRAAFDYHKP